MAQHILVILPHPDDECFNLAGTLAKEIRSGAVVTYVCLTLGEMGRTMGNPLFANRVTLPAVRRMELEESCRCIGIQDLRMWGLMDKTIEFEDQEMLIERITEVIREVQPEVMYTFYPGYSVHPDHDATGAAVVAAVARLPEASRPVVRCMAFSNGCEAIIGKPDVLNDVGDFLKMKVASILAHRSQFQMGAALAGKVEDDPEVRERFSMERYWTYRFE